MDQNLPSQVGVGRSHSPYPIHLICPNPTRWYPVAQVKKTIVIVLQRLLGQLVE